MVIPLDPDNSNRNTEQANPHTDLLDKVSMGLDAAGVLCGETTIGVGDNLNRWYLN